MPGLYGLVNVKGNVDETLKRIGGTMMQESWYKHDFYEDDHICLGRIHQNSIKGAMYHVLRDDYLRRRSIRGNHHVESSAADERDYQRNGTRIVRRLTIGRIKR